MEMVELLSRDLRATTCCHMTGLSLFRSHDNNLTISMKKELTPSADEGHQIWLKALESFQ